MPDGASEHHTKPEFKAEKLPVHCLAGMLAQARFLFTLYSNLPKMNATTKMV